MSQYEWTKTWRLNHPQRIKAHRKVFIEKRAGRLIQRPCEVCGENKSEAHHNNYRSPIKSIHWLCKPHHVLKDLARRLRK